MSNIRLMFNVTDRWSNVLFDTKTNTRFSKQDPIKTVPIISDNVMSLIKSGRIIDIDNVTGVKLDDTTIRIHNILLAQARIDRSVESLFAEETGHPKPSSTEEESKNSDIITEDSTISETEEVPEEEKTPKKRTPKKKKDEEGDN